jgi:hypothetical protein
MPGHPWPGRETLYISVSLALIGRISDQTEATRILHTLLAYYAQANPVLDRQQIRAVVTEIPNGDTIMPTLAEQWVQEGETKVLLRQIERKFGPPSEAIRRRVEEADPETILKWCDRILDADTLEAVLH